MHKKMTRKNKSDIKNMYKHFPQVREINPTSVTATVDGEYFSQCNNTSENPQGTHGVRGRIMLHLSLIHIYHRRSVRPVVTICLN